jgi:hypothetical protein
MRRPLGAGCYVPSWAAHASIRRVGARRCGSRYYGRHILSG